MPLLCVVSLALRGFCAPCFVLTRAIEGDCDGQHTAIASESVFISQPCLCYYKRPNLIKFKQSNSKRHCTMGDPLSVAGTAVGVVSLGLQVTGGLIKYHSNFTSYQEDITRITQSSERLCELLECLNDVLTKEEPEHSAVLEQVHRSVSACKGGLRLLKREVEKNRTIKLPVNTEDKARIIAKRLLYPFKKDTLHGVQVQLYALEDRLSFAVSLWNR